MKERLINLKQEILINLEELEIIYPYAPHLLNSLIGLLRTQPSDKLIELWFNSMKSMVEEVEVALLDIRNNH